MDKDRLMKEFSQLYAGKNTGQLVEAYVKKKRKEMLLLIIGAIFLVVLCAVKDVKNSRLDGNKVVRNNTEKGKKELVLQMKREEGGWEDVILELYPKEYSKEELEGLFVLACEELEEVIRNQNENLNSVSSDLNLLQEIEGYPFSLSWTSSNPQIISEDGQILYVSKDIDEMVELKAVFQYEDWEKTYSLWIHVMGTSKEDFVMSLEETLKEEESRTRKKEAFYLPKSFREVSLQWRYLPGNSAIILGILLFTIIPFISYEKDREIYQKTKKRKEQLQEDFPEFISKLVLFIEAGMNIRSAIFQIVADEEKKERKIQRFLYIELMYICKQMKNGLPETEAYKLLGKRCNLPSYKKLSGLLVQNLQKGGSNISDMLRNESNKAGEEQKRQIQKKGEEMGTKLLFPMMIMLGIVMVFIMVPALLSFQI